MAEAISIETPVAQYVRKPGYIYVMDNKCGYYKIGQSINPEERLKQISSAVVQPHKLELIAKIYVEDMNEWEHRFHCRYKDFRANGEWFKLDRFDLLCLTSCRVMAHLKEPCECGKTWPDLENDVYDNFGVNAEWHWKLAAKYHRMSMEMLEEFEALKRLIGEQKRMNRAVDLVQLYRYFSDILECYSDARSD